MSRVRLSLFKNKQPDGSYTIKRFDEPFRIECYKIKGKYYMKICRPLSGKEDAYEITMQQYMHCIFDANMTYEMMQDKSDMAITNALDCLRKGDVRMAVFYKLAGNEYKRRALEECVR